MVFDTVSEFFGWHHGGTTDTMSEQPMRAHHDACFGCGPGQPDGVHLQLASHGDHALARVVLDEHLSGPPRAAHGGIPALILDEVLGTTVNVLHQRPSVTGTLTVEYLAPTPIGAPVDAEAWLRETEGRKAFVEGVVRHEGEVTARGEAVFIQVPIEHFRGNRDAARAAVFPAERPVPAGAPIVDPHRSACFGCGSENPRGLQMRHARDGDEIVSAFLATPAFTGAPGTLHGGALAAALDDSMGTAPLVLAEELALTRALTIRFERPVLLGQALEIRSRIASREGRRITVTAETFAGENRLATATGTFVVVELSDEHKAKLFAGHPA